MAFIVEDESLYREVEKDYVLKDGKVYMKCKSWVTFDDKVIRGETIMNYINKKNSHLKKLRWLEEYI
jgi:hypothetical protein